MKKIEIVKNQLKAMKVEETINGYYVRWRKSKNRKIMLDDIFTFEDVMNEDGWFRIGTYEVRLTEEAFERLYKNYMDRLYSRSA